MTSTWSVVASTMAFSSLANPGLSFRPALLPVFILVANAALLSTSSAARADCVSACQSDYYACLHVSSTGTCSHRRSMCTNSCYAKGGGAATASGRSPILARPERTVIRIVTHRRNRPNAVRSASAGRATARSWPGSTTGRAARWRPMAREPMAGLGVARVGKQSVRRWRTAATAKAARSSA
jgi:hypothetical protein